MFIEKTKSILLWILAVSILVIPTSLGIYYNIDILPRITEISITIYGIITLSRFFLQLLFAWLNNRNENELLLSGELSFGKKVAILVCGWRENNDYFKMCLNSVKKLNYRNKTIICVIDGDKKLDKEMYEIFKNVFPSHNYVCLENGWENQEITNIVIEDYNKQHYQLNETITSERTTIFENNLKNKIDPNIPICVLRPHKGKRNAIYTGYKIIDMFNIPYTLTVDSDTSLERDSLSNLMFSFHNKEQSGINIGAITGEIKIFNVENFISFISSIRYWFAFNIERAAQSYWGCVSCVAGPLGLYKTSAVMEVIEEWYHQMFLGKPCTYGDDRHLTNKLLSKSYNIYYTPTAIAWTETPTTIKRFILQQIRWSKSFIREYYKNIFWFSKSSPYLMLDLTFMMLYSYFLAYIIISAIFANNILYTYSIIIIIILISLIKSLVAISMSKDTDNIFFIIYSFVFIVYMIPIKLSALITLFDISWGTGNRKETKLECCNINIFIVLLWNLILFGAIGKNIYEYYSSYEENSKLVTDVFLYSVIGFFACMLFLYKNMFEKHKMLRKNVYDRFLKN